MFWINSLRDEFIDFSLPHYENGGTTLLMKRPVSDYNFLLFVEVFSYEVWICIISIIVGTALLIYLYEIIRVTFIIIVFKKIKFIILKTKLTKDEIQYNLSDSFWHTIGSFTLAGGTILTFK